MFFNLDTISKLFFIVIATTNRKAIAFVPIQHLHPNILFQKTVAYTFRNHLIVYCCTVSHLASLGKNVLPWPKRSSLFVKSVSD